MRKRPTAAKMGLSPSAPPTRLAVGTSRRNRSVSISVIVFGIFGAVAGSAQAEVTAEQVRQAIDRGVAFILKEQRANGSWPDMDTRAAGYEGNHSGGVGALCTLALLNAGVSSDDDRVQRALKHLRTIPTKSTYVVSLQTMVFARASPEDDRAIMERNVKWLESVQTIEGPNGRAWSYPTRRTHRNGDNSNTQFALLALHEAERVGVVADEQTWRDAKTYWEHNQNDDGSWGYMTGSPDGTLSMTCAGITSMVIAADNLRKCDAATLGDSVQCCVALEPTETDRIDRAVAWLGQHYTVARNPGINWLYYLYGLERVGRLTGCRFIPLPPRQGQPDRTDWYREGAEELVRCQDRLTGAWRDSYTPLIDTSFALLFLSKGRWPVLLGKLQHDDGGDWNHHRHDVGNLTRYVETRWRRDLTWQVIDLRLASVDDLIQTPVLYLCGSQSPLPEDPTERKKSAQKLRGYVDRGGFLMAEADCGCGDFDQGFRDLMREAFPEPDFQLRLLEREHPIWSAEEKIDPGQLRPLWGIESGCRTSVVYAPPDPADEPRPSLSCLWELSRPGRGVQCRPAVQAQVDAALSLGINVLAYATNRELKNKEDFFRPTAPVAPLERGLLDVATLRHPGNCNAAPRAVVNLMDSANRQLRLRTRVREEPLDITDPSLFDCHLVFMHGRTAFCLTDAERRQLRQYLERGGMLLADSICASEAFTKSFRQEIAAIFPDRKLQPIPGDDPLLSTTYGGCDLRVVSRRDPKTADGINGTEAAICKVSPELEGVRLGDRWGVVFSHYDLSCALERQDSTGCRGYTREDAARIGLNVMLYSLQQ